MTLLSQVIAAQQTARETAKRDLTRAHQALQRPAPLAGIHKTYEPRDSDGEKLPSESVRVEMHAELVIAAISKSLARAFDVVAAVEFGNASTAARADVVVGEGENRQVLIEKAPVPYLLFLQKQLVDLTTFVRKLPVLDAADEWVSQDDEGAWMSTPEYKTRSRKIPTNHVLAAATDRHPAQVEVVYVDQIVGDYRTVRYSGAVPAARVRQLTERIEELRRAVTYAQWQANSAEVDDKRGVGRAVLDYLFAA